MLIAKIPLLCSFWDFFIKSPKLKKNEEHKNILFIPPSNIGKPTIENISRSFENKVEKDSTLVKDKATVYIKIAQINDLKHVYIKENRVVGGISYSAYK